MPMIFMLKEIRVAMRGRRIRREGPGNVVIFGGFAGTAVAKTTTAPIPMR